MNRKEKMEMALVFVEHIEEHLENQKICACEVRLYEPEVQCKICKKPISQIWKEFNKQSVLFRDR